MGGTLRFGSAAVSPRRAHYPLRCFPSATASAWRAPEPARQRRACGTHDRGGLVECIELAGLAHRAEVALGLADRAVPEHHVAGGADRADPVLWIVLSPGSPS